MHIAIQEYKEYHTDTEVHFQLFFTAAKLQEVLSGGGPHQKLKLVGKASIGEAWHTPVCPLPDTGHSIHTNSDDNRIS